MPQTPFRDEVLQSRRRGWLGSISLAQPLRSWLLTLVAAIVAMSIVLFVCLGSYTRRATVTGTLVPTQGLINVLAPATGIVSWLEVQEGERVGLGAPIAMVSVPRPTADNDEVLGAFEHRLRQRTDSLLISRQAQRDQIAVQSAGLSAQLATAQRELMQIELELGARAKQIRIANETLARLRRPDGGQLVSAVQITQQENALLDYTIQRQALQRQATSVQRLIEQLGQQLQELPVKGRLGESTHQRQLLQLEQERAQTGGSGALIIKAPVDGLVSLQLVKPGQGVQAGQPLMSLLPGDGRLEAELMVPSRAIGFIAPGDKVLLRYQAFPYQQFGHQLGRVETISHNALEVRDGMDGESYYRITVSLHRQSIEAYGKLERLRAGMRLEADVMGEHRRLIEWLLEPLRGIRGGGGFNPQD